MTDREMLELAAQAAGKTIDQKTFGEYQDAHRGMVVADGEHWNPLNDDGDALRLAVACDMTVCADGLTTVSACSGYGHDKVMVTQAVSECGNDKSAATRRAAVLADREGRQQEQLVAAAKRMTKLYPHVWDRSDGALVVFPENVERFDAAFDGLRIALGEAVEDPDFPLASAQRAKGESDA